MQTILLMFVICAASGFTLEMPELPDLIATLGKVFHGNFTLKMVEEPDVFLPKVPQIETMTREESMERFHWFFCVYVLIFLGVTLLGSVIMFVGPILKSKCLASSDSAESSELLSSDSEASDSSVSSYEALGPTFTALSPRTQQCLVILSVGVTMSLSLVASMWSLKTGRLSKVTGLDWEIYLILFCCVGLSLLVQAVWAVARLRPGDRFDATAFAVAAFTSMAPIISDFYDTVKDVIFGALCLQSKHLMIQILGVVSWLYLCMFHAWFVLVGDKDCKDWLWLYLFDRRGRERGGSGPEAAQLQAAGKGYKQLTPSKREYLLIENLPQAVFSVLFLLVEGGSLFVGVLNLLVPGVQILLTFLCFRPVLSAAAPALGKKLNRAMRNGDMATAFLLWEEAELWHWRNLQLFGLILPRLTFFLDTLSRHGFDKDPTELNEGELLMVQRIGQAAACLGQAEIRCDNLGELGTKVVAEAMATNTVTDWLDLDANNIGDAGAQALGEALKVNVTLKNLDLEDNNIGAAGAQALGEALKINVTLTKLFLNQNNIGAAGAQALAESLKINRSLKKLRLDHNNIGTAGATALGEALKTNGSLETLWLQENNIGASGAQALGEALTTNSSLEELNLVENNVGSSGAQALGEGLKVNVTLTKLHLEKNNIGDAGAQALAESLKINRSLEYLDLALNNGSLETLWLQENNIGDAGAQALGEALKVNVTLRILDLEKNNIGDAGALALAAGLLQNRSLRELWLGRGSVGVEGRQALKDAEKTKTERGEDFQIYWSR
eukprot:s1665_g31.t1